MGSFIQGAVCSIGLFIAGGVIGHFLDIHSFADFGPRLVDLVGLVSGLQ